MEIMLNRLIKQFITFNVWEDLPEYETRIAGVHNDENDIWDTSRKK